MTDALICASVITWTGLFSEILDCLFVAEEYPLAVLLRRSENGIVNCVYRILFGLEKNRVDGNSVSAKERTLIRIDTANNALAVYGIVLYRVSRLGHFALCRVNARRCAGNKEHAGHADNKEKSYYYNKYYRYGTQHKEERIATKHVNAEGEEVADDVQ